MSNLKSLHIDMANVLIECAKRKETISYKDLGIAVEYTKPLVTMGRELEEISMRTFARYGIFLSALVVQKEMKQRGMLLCGDGFYTMYIRECPNDTRSRFIIENEQREKIYAQDWCNLLDMLHEELNGTPLKV